MTTPEKHATTTATGTGKTHLPILDGLRGVAALIVVAYHIFDSDPVNSVNHGYLAVDFFFMLSGFVMGYAYDDRWNRMSLGSFLKRRLVRLHPMVIVGSVIGALLFHFGASELFGNIAGTSMGMLLLSLLLGALLIPSPKSLEVRGWGESYPLNGPAWSLLFEYIANVAYALWLRKAGLRTLALIAAASAAILVPMTVLGETGTVSFGWLPTGEHFAKGLVRVIFPFSAGLLLFRLGRTITMRNALLVTSAALLIALPMPRVGPADMPWMNGLYESLVIVLLFPILVLIGAGSRPASRFAEKACDFLGRLSYPLYLVHYPIHYVFFAWLSDRHASAASSLPAAALVYAASLALAWIVMRFIDEPLRKRLATLTR